MAAIGTGWADGAWVQAGWITGAWSTIVNAVVGILLIFRRRRR